MLRAVKYVKFLKLSSVVCVFDQAIYSKGIKIKWKEKERFENVVLIIGMFHTIMMHMHIFSKRFSDADVRDVLIHSGTIAEGSIVKALIGNMYSRGTRTNQLIGDR